MMKYNFNLKSIGADITFQIPTLGNEENLKNLLDEILSVIDKKVQLKISSLLVELLEKQTMPNLIKNR